MANRHKAEEFAVIGLGRFGSSLALGLEAAGHHVLGIDSSPELVQAIADDITHAVTLDATNEDALRAVDITTFDTVIVAIGSNFESNLMTTVALKTLGVKHVICKAPTARQSEILLRVGADRVVQPESEAGFRLAEELSAPLVLEKLSLGTEHSVAELVAPNPIVYKSLAQSDLRNKHGVIVLVVKRGDEVRVAPPADFIINQDDILVVIGRHERIQKFCALE